MRRRFSSHSSAPRPMRRMGFIDTRSFGASLYELNPWNYERIRQEYEAVGKVPPSYSDVAAMALDDSITAGRESVSNISEAAGEIGAGVANLAKWGIVAFGLYVALQLLGDGKRRRK